MAVICRSMRICRRAAVCLASFAVVLCGRTRDSHADYAPGILWFDPNKALLLIGPNVGGVWHRGGSDSSGLVIGGEVSVARPPPSLGSGASGLWYGGYVDCLYDNAGPGAMRVSLGPEIGWTVLGLDGGLFVETDFNRSPRLGLVARPMLALGIVDVYSGFGAYAGGGGYFFDVGVLLKLPIPLSPH